MGPLDLALAGSSIFSGVGGAVDSGTSAGKAGDLAPMRSKEYVSSALVLATGVAFAIREKAWWPVLVSTVLVGLLIGLHEYHARKNLPAPDTSVLIGPWK